MKNQPSQEEKDAIDKHGGDVSSILIEALNNALRDASSIEAFNVGNKAMLNIVGTVIESSLNNLKDGFREKYIADIKEAIDDVIDEAINEFHRENPNESLIDACKKAEKQNIN